MRTGGDGVPTGLRRSEGWLAIEQVLDRWRTDDRWWTEQPVSRTYYELLLEDGRTVTIFHNEIEDSWREQHYG